MAEIVTGCASAKKKKRKKNLIHQTKLLPGIMSYSLWENFSNQNLIQFSRMVTWETGRKTAEANLIHQKYSCLKGLLGGCDGGVCGGGWGLVIQTFRLLDKAY